MQNWCKTAPPDRLKWEVFPKKLSFFLSCFALPLPEGQFASGWKFFSSLFFCFTFFERDCLLFFWLFLETKRRKDWLFIYMNFFFCCIVFISRLTEQMGGRGREGEEGDEQGEGEGSLVAFFLSKILKKTKPKKNF